MNWADNAYRGDKAHQFFNGSVIIVEKPDYQNLVEWEDKAKDYLVKSLGFSNQGNKVIPIYKESYWTKQGVYTPFIVRSESNFKPLTNLICTWSLSLRPIKLYQFKNIMAKKWTWCKVMAL